MRWQRQDLPTSPYRGCLSTWAPDASVPITLGRKAREETRTWARVFSLWHMARMPCANGRSGQVT